MRPITPEEEAAVVRVGGAAAAELVVRLGGRLQTEIADRGPAGALAFCSLEGLPLTAAAGGDLGLDLKRTSSRIRNPRNAPDSLEALALARYAPGASEAEPPAHVVQRSPEGGFRYYQPLRIAPPCLQCHGAADELGPGVREVLDESYPADEATGYRLGDLRGLIRVGIPAGAVDPTP